MKKIIAIIMIALGSIAQAGTSHLSYQVHSRHNHFHHVHRVPGPVIVSPHRFHYGHRHHWVVPAVIGGAVVYSIANNNIAPQVIPLVVDQSDTIVINGVLYKKTVMIVNGIEQQVFVKVETNEIITN